MGVFVKYISHLFKPIGEYSYDLLLKPLEQLRLKSKRKQLLHNVHGNVLEVGYGTGVNLKYYRYNQLDSLTLIDQKTSSIIHLNTFNDTLDFNVYVGNVTDLPFDDESFDCVVFTLVFCSVDDPHKGIDEIKRVLKPDGKIYFMEHVLPSRKPYKQVFNKLTPIWKKIANGCCLNRETLTTILHSGFELEEYHRFFRTSFVMGIGKVVK